jgi:hypothetical protein
MAYMARQVGGGFTAGAKLFASQLNDELNHILTTFIGTESRNVKIKYNSGDEPTLELWNSGGNPLEIRVGGGEDLRVHVDNVGTIVSAVATGTAAPITVASTAVCTNLNADTIDGHELAALIQTDVAEQTITHASAEVNLKLLAVDQGVDAGLVAFYFDMRDGTDNVDALWRLVGHGDDTFYLQQYDDSETAWVGAMETNVLDGTPYFKVWDEALGTLQQVATTKSRTIAQIGVFYEGAVTTAAKQATFLSSDDVEELIFTHAKYVYRGGTPDEDTLISIKTWSDADPPVEQQEVVLTVVQEDTADVTYTVDITDIAVAAGESLTWECTQTGIHEDISIWLIGTQEIKTD